jgi:propionyl-CoA carboxylase alpha chain
MFDRILIANRGEIACRVMRTARRLGIATVAVFSEADRNALHLQFADEVIGIGPAPPRESYLAMDEIVRACLKTGATAVHPGYGFLAENAEFCERLQREGITFIGPKADSIRMMGDKIAAKMLAREAGVNVIPGSDIVPEDSDAACRMGAELGYPVILKAVAGGGGKGVRVARDDVQLREAFVACRNEAQSSFGDDRVFVEKLIEEPRHIEFQVLGDAFGHVVHLWERDCSIQRRHQKVIEEAPAPFLDRHSREAMGAQSVALAKAAGYQSAGTVEFIVDRDGSFYFLEMNTRIQVEHPVTEMITGVDVVEAMIRVAAGEPLPFSQEDIRCDGWAVECRINAEDPFHNFLPSIGRLVRYIPPRESEGRVRVDTGVAEGGMISPHYDSMIAKVITHDVTREGAVAMMRQALDQFVVRGVETNIAFQAALLRHSRFIAGDFHTGFMAEEYPSGFDAADMPHVDKSLLVAVAAFVHRSRIDRQASVSGQLPGHELKVAEGWTVVLNGERYPVTVRPMDGGYVVLDAQHSSEIVSGWRLGQPLFCGARNGKTFCVQVEHIGQMYRLTHGGTQTDVSVMNERTTELLLRMPQKPERDLSRFLLSPMPGLVTLLQVVEGQSLRVGEPLLVIEAMKMENVLRADRDCVIDRLLVSPGDSVAVGQRVMEFR